jgi:glycosyltransferase involved in cell wall biosynthesis
MSLTIMQSNFHLLWGGQAEVVLAGSLALCARGHRVIVAAPPDSELDQRARAAGLEVFTGCRFRKGFRPVSFWRDVDALGRFFQAQAVQIHHAHGSQDHWTAAVASRRFRVKTQIVRSRHNVYPIRNHWFNRTLFRKWTAATIATAERLKERFTASGLLTEDRLDVLHSPLPAAFEADDAPKPILRGELNLAAADPVVGFTANFHPDKAPLVLLEAVPEILKAEPKAKFIFIGHGPLDQTLRERTAALGLQKCVFFPGFRSDIRAVMAAFDVFVLPSVTREASSTVLKMAGALKIPAITTDVGGSAEIVAHQETGLVVPVGDGKALAEAVSALLCDPERRKTMGRVAREKVLRNYTASALAEKTEAIYRRILS